LFNNVLGNNITGNTINTSGMISNHGITLESNASNNRFEFNNISTAGILSYGIQIITSNGSLFNATLLNNTVEWINTTENTLNNFTNTTFEMPDGSINLINAIIQINGTQDVTKQRLNITENKAFLNSSNLTFFNNTAIIILRNISNFLNPQPIVDLEDDGTFTACDASICTELDFGNEVFEMNVTHFTSYSTTELDAIFNFTNISVTKIDNPDPVENGTQLNYSIFVNVTGNGTAFNVTVNETYPADTIFDNATPLPSLGTNNTFILGNLSPGTNFTINITLNVTQIANGTLINNTVNTTYQNETGHTLQIGIIESTTVEEIPFTVTLMV